MGVSDHLRRRFAAERRLRFACLRGTLRAECSSDMGELLAEPALIPEEHPQTAPSLRYGVV
jgi:hypothetical protein